MIKFTKRLFIFLSVIIIPLFTLLIGYIVYDPFKVIYNYENYSNLNVVTSRDYISSQMFLKNKIEYDSFIFGSSRTLAFSLNTWKEYFDKEAKPFVFDASKENISGIYSKIKYLDKTKSDIRNAIILICQDATFKNESENLGHIYTRHHQISNNSLLNFHMEFLKAYFKPKFLTSFYNLKFVKKHQSWMNGIILNKNIIYHPISNETFLKDLEDELKDDEKLYYENRKNVFYNRQGGSVDTVKRIKVHHINMLKSIKKVFEKHKTKYKVVISPLYNQIKFSEDDMQTLDSIFSGNLYDFSGNNELTNDYRNYYETSHFRKFIGNRILKNIYSTED